MKKYILLIILIIIFIACSISIYLVNVNILKDNKRYYEYFMEEKLVGVDGDVNLSSVKLEHNNLYNELLDKFKQDSYDYNSFFKIIKEKIASNDDIKKEIDSLASDISNLEDKKSSLNSEYSILEKKYNDLKKKQNVTVNQNNSYNFPLINQYPNYQTGCESVALTMLLKYYGVNVNPDMVISRLKKGSVPYYENGILYGANPEIEFVGNPYSKNSYGVYESPIMDVANSFKSGIKGGSNIPFSNVVSLVQNGTPVMAWTSMGLSLPYISKSWIYKPTGEVISWKANEHAVVIVGVNGSSIVVADPIGGKLKSYSKGLFEQRYNYYGRKVLYY